MNVVKCISIVCILMFHIFNVNAELSIHEFSTTSYNKILDNNDGNPFTLIFWSTTCSPCIEELTHIATSKMYVNQKFIFVSVDYGLSPNEIRRVVSRLQLEELEHWLFQAEDIQAIITSVDKNWYGEVPRNYYFDEEHVRTRLQEIK